MTTPPPVVDAAGRPVTAGRSAALHLLHELDKIVHEPEREPNDDVAIPYLLGGATVHAILDVADAIRGNRPTVAMPKTLADLDQALRDQR